MKKIMTAAHEIKRAAAKKWNCSESEIVFGICLSMAHKGEEIKRGIEMETTMKYGTKNIELKITAMNEWSKGNHNRTYLTIDGIERAREINKIFIDNSGTARLNTYDIDIETGRGRAVIQTNGMVSGKKTDAIKNAICEMLERG